MDKIYQPQYKTTFQCFLHTIRTNGILSLWQGWTGTAIRNIPANALFFPMNEIMKHTISESLQIDQSQLLISHRLASGAIAGLCYWVGTYPLDVIKGRMQAQSYDNRMNWIQTAVSIYKDGGINQFRKGLAPCAARSIPACSAMFATVDITRDYLKSML